MQLPGMSTQPVRVSIEITWHPYDGTWSIARRAWRMHPDHGWQLEEMATSGTPLNVSELITKLEAAVSNLVVEIADADEPFGDIGPFH